MNDNSSEYSGYRLFQFIRGRKQIVRSSGALPNDVIAEAREFNLAFDVVPHDQWDKIEIVETQLIIKPRSPYAQRCFKENSVTHSLANLEKKKPNTLFVAAIAHEVFKQKSKEADAIGNKCYADLERCIREAVALSAQEVLWKDVAQEWQECIRINGNACWIWKTIQDKAPYRRVYVRLKGPIPKGALLRHSCDNPLCVNPNHLTLGTPAENVRDMMERERHAIHNWARARLTQRALYQRYAALNALWTQDLLEKAASLSDQGLSAAQIAREFDNGISSGSVTTRLYYYKQAKAKQARKAARRRRAEKMKKVE